MPVNLRGRHYLKLLDYTPAEIRYLLELSKDFKRMKRSGTPHKYLAGKNIVLLFEKTSTRTRCSFEVAGRDLGLGVTYLDPGSSQMGKKESPSLTPPGCWAACSTALNTAASARRLWRTWPITPVFPFGTASPMSSTPPKCWRIC